MYKKIIEIDLPISSQLDSELKKRLYYMLDGIISFETKIKNEQIYEIVFELSSDISNEVLKSKLDNLLDFDIRNRTILPENNIWKSENKTEYDDSIYEKMVKDGIIFEQGCGQVAFNSLFIKLMSYLDDRIKEISINKFDALEFQYPTLIPTSVVNKCGYTRNFPQLMMFVTFLHSDINNYMEYKNHFNKKGTIPELNKGNYYKDIEYCLPPTMCYYTYNQFANKKFKDGENFVVTSKGKSFRYEHKYAETVERLWDFTIRETVFLGDYNFVKSCRERFMELIFELIQDLKLSGYCCSASDSFFIDEQMTKNITFQKMLKSKYEMHLYISGEKSIAVGSFNYHDSFFGKNFNMAFENGNFIKTGCTGFGLERLAYAFICQYGLDQDKWPIKI